MKNIQYAEMLKEAFLITWKNKFLWFFGFLILIGSVSSNFNLSNNSSGDQESKTQSMAVFFQNNPTFFTMLSLALIFVVIILFILRIMASAGIIKSVNDINLYRQMSIIAILRESRTFLWRLLLMELLIGSILFVIAIAMATPIVYLFVIKATIIAYIILIAAILIFLPLLILAFYLSKYASFFIILANEKIVMSLEYAYRVFLKNVKESLLMGMIFIILNLLLVIAIMLIALAIAIVFAPFALVAYLIFAKIGAIVIISIGICLLVIALVIFLSAYQAFLSAAWLLFFQQISFEKNEDKTIVDKIIIEDSAPSPEAI